MFALAGSLGHKPQPGDDASAAIGSGYRMITLSTFEPCLRISIWPFSGERPDLVGRKIRRTGQLLLGKYGQSRTCRQECRE